MSFAFVEKRIAAAGSVCLSNSIFDQLEYSSHSKSMASKWNK